MKISLLASVSALLLSSSISAEPCPAFAKSHVPASLTADNPPVIAKTDCVSVSVGSRVFLAAAYSNGGGVLSIFDPSTNPPSLVGETKEPMVGHVYDLKTIDLDADGRNEVVVLLRFRMSEELWAYSLSDTGTPALISPSEEAGGPITGPILLDLDGTGKISIIDTKTSTVRDEQGDTDVENSFTLFTLQNGKYTKDNNRSLYFARSFERETGAPSTATAEVSVPDAGRFRLTLLNGDSNGKNRCSAALVKFGDQTVIAPNDLNQQKYVVTKDVVLATENPVSVTLRSESGCKVWILIGNSVTTP